MNPETHPIEVFAPLPVRSRGVLEMIDTSIKLYKQYFLKLIGWSAAARVISALFLILPGVHFFSYLVAPLANVLPLGAAVCCIAAAVRGQDVSFKQCWMFTKPRYWPLVLVTVLAQIIMAFTMAIIMFGILMVTGMAVFGLTNTPSAVQTIGGFIGLPILAIAIIMVLVIAFMWQGMVSIVICMEDGNRNVNALGRAWDLLKQNWMRVVGLMCMFSLLMLVLLGLMAFALYLTNALPQFNDILQGHSPTSSFSKDMSAFGVAAIALSIIWDPWNHLILSLLYLDLRVRKEALDLEWTAHVSAPGAAAGHGIMASGPGLPGQFATALNGGPMHTWGADAAAAGDPAAQGYQPVYDYPAPPAAAAAYAAPPQAGPSASGPQQATYGQQVAPPFPASQQQQAATPADTGQAGAVPQAMASLASTHAQSRKCQLCGSENPGLGDRCEACGAHLAAAA